MTFYLFTIIVVEDDSSSYGSCDGEPLSLAEDVKHKLAPAIPRGIRLRLYRPPFTCGQCNRAVYLWRIYCDGCIHCLVGVECLAKWFKDRNMVKWVLQMCEKEVQVETILKPTLFVNVGGSSTSVASCAEASSTPLGPVAPSSIPCGMVDVTPSSDHPTSHAGCHSAEPILADVFKALGDSHGSFHPSLSKVEALLGDDLGQPLHVTVLGLSLQQYESEVRHFRDLTSESYAIDCAEIVVYYLLVAQNALNVDWDTMGVA